MTVEQLIDILKTKDPDTMVIVRGYEGGYNDLNNVEHMQLELNVNTAWYYGKHEQKENGVNSILLD